ncbi:MAG: division/cell wall cluster transcriptional repressor MraZ [Pseudomonadota bacterium]
MFIGTNIVKPDAKGRLAVPARHRERLRDCCASRVSITVHPKGKICLWMYPWDEWEQVAASVANLPPLNEQNARLQHLLLSNAFELELDGQGRILLPPYLRQHADIGGGRDVAVVGQGRRFEIWDAEAWSALNAEYVEAINQPGSELSAELQNLLL